MAFTAQRTLELAKSAAELWVSRSGAEKRALLEMMVSNPTLTGRKVAYELKKPFAVLAEIRRKGWAPQWRRKQEPKTRGVEPGEEAGTRAAKTAKTARSPANRSTSRPCARVARADRPGRTADAGGARSAFRTPSVPGFKHPLSAPASPSHPGAHCKTGGRYPERPERTLASTDRAPSAL